MTEPTTILPESQKIYGQIAELEQQVEQRTAELRTTIRHLENEIARRRQAEETLHHMQDELAQQVADQSRKLAALYEVIILSGQSMELKELLNASLAEIMTVVGAQAACLHQLEGDTLRLMTGRGLVTAIQFHFETLPAAWLPADKTPRWIPNLSQANVNLPSDLADLQTYLGVPIELCGQVVGMLSLFWAKLRPFSVEDFALFKTLADQLGIIIEHVRLRKLGEEAAALRERQRLARDLHDSVTQALHSLVLFAETIAATWQQSHPDHIPGLLRQLTGSAQQALKEMRLLLYELQPVTSPQVDLVALLNDRLDSVERRAGIDARLIADDAPVWPPAWNEQVWRIALEALNNSLKHARAGKVTVILRSQKNNLDLTVTDNGCGFNPDHCSPGGMGLPNMVARAKQLAGKLYINSTPGGGTTVRLIVTTG